MQITVNHLNHPIPPNLSQIPVWPNFPEKDLPEYAATNSSSYNHNKNKQHEEDEESEYEDDSDFEEHEDDESDPRHKNKNFYQWKQVTKTSTGSKKALHGKRKAIQRHDDSEEEEEENNFTTDTNNGNIVHGNNMYNYGDGSYSNKPYKLAENNSSATFEVSNQILSHLAGYKPIQTFPSLMKQYVDWDHLQQYLEEYGKKHFVKFALKSSNTVKAENKKKNKLLFDEKYVYFRKTFICTHGWGVRYRGKAGSISATRNTDCPAMLNAQLANVAGSVVVKIHKNITTHNHSCNQELWDSYHEQRRIMDSETLGVVDKMIEYKMERGHIWQYIRRQGKTD